MTSGTRSMTMALAPLFTARQSLDPARTPDERFDLLSIPAYDTGAPEVVGGIEIGSTKLIVHPGDTLISKIVPHIQRVWVVPPRGSLRQIASSEWIVLRSERTDPSYLRYVLLEQGFHSRFMATVDGLSGSLQRARPQLVRRIEIPVPPLREQRAIADFLDRETAQIDAFIAKNAELIALLTERRAVAIAAAFGRYPSIPLKYLVQRDRPLTYGILQCGEPREVGVPYIGPADMPGEGASPELGSLRRTTPEIAAAYQRSVLSGGDIVVSIGPAFGRVALLDSDLEGANLTQDTVRVAFRQSLVDGHYLVWALSSRAVFDYWDHEILGATFRRLNLGTLANTPIPLPPIEEQPRIAAEARATAAKADLAIDVARKATDLARERRAALISAAVTGKIDVGVSA